MNSFKHKLVNDLYWSINSIYKHELESVLIRRLNNISFSNKLDLYVDLFEFTYWDENPKELLDFIGDYNNKPLGVYFESLCRFYFRKHVDFEIVFENHQIIENKITITEFDLCVKDLKKNLYHHIEFSVKFYLENNNAHNPIDWIGPNAKDNFKKKLLKTENQFKQAERYIDLELNKVFFLKGLNFKYKKTNYWWCRIGEEQELLNSSLIIAILPKQYWLGLNDFKQKELEFFSKNDSKKILMELIKLTNKSVCIGLFQKNKKHYKEIERGFIVNKNWPN